MKKSKRSFDARCAVAKPDITVFIPTYFGEDTLDELFRMVFRQKINKSFEVLVYDTSSTDKTPEIIQKYAKKHANLRYKTITKAEYGHGKTRAAAAHDARGDIVVYLSQDATPTNIHWLYEMVKPFEISEKVVGVLGRQLPRPKAPPILKHEIKAVFANLGPEDGLTLYYNDYFVKTKHQYDLISFYSDVNSAARRSILTGEIPYKDTPYAEDQLFGRDVIDAGYIKAYAARGSVFHSNDVRLRDYKARLFDETRGLRSVGIHVEPPARRTVLKMIVRGSLMDCVRTLRDREYSLKRKAYFLFTNPLYHIEKWRGVRLGARVNLDDGEKIDKHSLESQQSRKNN